MPDIQPAGPDDAEELLALQKAAFQTEAEIYGDFSIPPLTQTLEELRAEMSRMSVLKAVEAGRIIGSVRAVMETEACHIMRLMVNPQFRCRGVGTALMKAVEKKFPAALCFRLETGHLSEANLRLYRTLGYQEVKRAPMNKKIDFVFLEKMSTGWSR